VDALFFAFLFLGLLVFRAIWLRRNAEMRVLFGKKQLNDKVEIFTF